jgi:hypothetical protein
MNERILNSFGELRVAKTLRSNCEAVPIVLTHTHAPKDSVEVHLEQNLPLVRRL